MAHARLEAEAFRSRLIGIDLPRMEIKNGCLTLVAIDPSDRPFGAGVRESRK